MKKKFVHLHVHSEYSLLDGLLKTDDLIKKAIESEMPAVALTDHGNMYGVIDFYKAAIRAGIKPIIGCEVYQAPKNRFEKKFSRDTKEGLYNHLTLLVENNEGYQNLMQLVSLGFLEGFYYKPRIDGEVLRKYSKGLIALSGCMSGKVPRFVEQGRIDKAEQAIQEYIDIFGNNNFFLELTDFGMAKQREVNETLFELSKKYNIGVVATNDVHYLNSEDYKYHFILLCVQAGATIGDFQKLGLDISADSDLGDTIKNIILKLAEQEALPGGINSEKSEKTGFFPRTMEYYFKNSDEMTEIFKEFPGAVENTIKIAERCNIELDFDLGLIPPFKVPDNNTPDEYLRSLCSEGLSKKYTVVNDEITSRLDKELEVIRKMGFAEYFLIVWDFVKFAKNNDIRVGPGRGSAAGSIVSYLLDITDIEPLKYDLLFERFLNEERKKMPDIDIDFCDEKRDQVIDYVTEKYGENRVAQLITFGTMAARQAIRDAGRVLEVPYSEVDRIAKLVPSELNIKIDSSLEMVPELKDLYTTDKKVRDIIDTAKSLEGKARQHSIHAAGVVISSKELFHYTPIQRDEKSGDIKTQYKMEDIQDIGLLKMDFLGLKTLSLIDKTLFLIKKTKNLDLDINIINLDDKKTFEMLCNGDCMGVFQLESSGMRELVVNLKPERFEDIIATLALFRPGPLQSGMVNDFIDAKNKNKKIKYFHPSLEPILKDTYGIILYQEQIMLIVSKLAGFSMSEADILRDAISKKKRELMSKQKSKFLDGAKRMDIVDQNTASKLFELITHFAEYGFNKSHSTAYAMISYQTAYLKANYPVEFLAALLSIRMGSQEKVAQYINESRRMGIKVFPPDINESFTDFTVVGSSIRFGLSAIKNVGSNVLDLIIDNRKESGRFLDFQDFCGRVSNNVLNKKTIESLVKAGAFDTLGYSRKYLLENYENFVEKATKIKKSIENGQFSLFDGTADNGSENTGSDFQLHDPINMEEINNEYSSRKLLNFEKEILGLYISGHPLADFDAALSGFSTIEDLADQQDKSTQVIAGVISGIKQIITKSNQPMYFLTLEDFSDNIEVIIFPNLLEKYRSLLEEDRVIKIKGKLDKKEDQIKMIAIEIEELKKSNTVNNPVNLSNDTEFALQNESSVGPVDVISESRKKYGTLNSSQEKDNSGNGGTVMKSNKIILRIGKDLLNKDIINGLYDIMKNNPGDVTVELHITTPGSGPERTYNFGSSYMVNIKEDFFRELRSRVSDSITWEMYSDIN